MSRGAAIILVAGMLSAPAASALDESGAVERAVDRCLSLPSSLIPATTPAGDLPPGLSRGKNVHVEPITGTGGKGYGYEGTSLREISCGVALYGPVPRSLESRLEKLIESHKERWTRHAPGPYQLPLSVPARQSYWGTALTGVLLLARAPSVSAPTLEIDVHTILVS